MGQYEDIRRYIEKEGLSERAVAKLMGISRNTVRKYRNGDVIPGKRNVQNRAAHVLTEKVTETVLGYYEEEKDAPSKQKYTARSILKRLRKEEEFVGSYSSVKHLVRQLKGVTQVFIPLEFDPGQAAQVDWGSAVVYMNGHRTKVELFCMRLCNSAAPFVMAFPTQRYESFLEGHVKAFEFFKGTCRTLIYDNLRTAVKEGWGKHVKEEQAPFKLLKAHYVFASRFCAPGKGNEKSLVENLVGLCRRNTLVPVPRVNSYEELNALLLEGCKEYHDHKIESRPDRVGQMLAVEQQHMIPLPGKPFDPAVVTTAMVNSSSLVRYDNSYYSVPCKLVGNYITLKAYPLFIEVWHKHKIVAKHTRSYKQSHVAYELEHYLPVLDRKIRAVRDAAPVKRTVHASIRAFGEKLTDRGFVDVLILSVDYGEIAVIKAIELAMHHEQYTFEAVRFNVLQSLQPTRRKSRPIEVDPSLPLVNPVDLSSYDVLLGRVAGNE